MSLALTIYRNPMIQPQTAGLFSKEVPGFQKAEWQPTPALAANIEAIINPTEVLARKQTEQVLQLASQFKTDALDYELATKGQREIEEFKTKVADMYKGNKGMARLQLTPSQKLELSKMQGDLMKGIDWGKQATTYWGDAQKLMASAMQKGTISPDEFSQWSTEWEGKFKDKKTRLADVGNPYLDAVNYLNSKPQVQEGTLPKDKLAFFKALNYSQTGETSGEYDPNKTVSAFDTQLTSTDVSALKNRWGMSNMSDDEFKQWALTGAKENFNPAELRGRGGMQFSFNPAGGQDRYTPTVEMVGDTRYHNISGKAPADTYGNYSGKYTAIRENPDGTCSVFITQAVDASGNVVPSGDKEYKSFMESRGGKQSKDPNMKGGFWMPYTKSVEAVLQQNNIVTDKINVKKYATYTPQSATQKKRKPQTLTPEAKTSLNKPTTKVWTPDLAEGEWQTIDDLIRAGFPRRELENAFKNGDIEIVK